MNNLTITMSGYGTSRESYRIDFRPPCLAAPSWLMSDNMQISFRQGAQGADIPILAFHVGTGMGIPRDAAIGILVNGKPMVDRDYILITLSPVKSSRTHQEYTLNATMKSGKSSVCAADYSIFEEVVTCQICNGDDSRDFEWLAGVLFCAVERAESSCSRALEQHV